MKEQIGIGIVLKETVGLRQWEIDKKRIGFIQWGSDNWTFATVESLKGISFKLSSRFFDYIFDFLLVYENDTTNVQKCMLTFPEHLKSSK